MSPEQAMGEKIDARTDIFSFGVVLFEMRFGKVPFANAGNPATGTDVIQDTLSSVGGLENEISPALNQIVKHALEKDRHVRYQSTLLGSHRNGV